MKPNPYISATGVQSEQDVDCLIKYKPANMRNHRLFAGFLLSGNSIIADGHIGSRFIRIHSGAELVACTKMLDSLASAEIDSIAHICPGRSPTEYEESLADELAQRVARTGFSGIQLNTTSLSFSRRFISTYMACRAACRKPGLPVIIIQLNMRLLQARGDQHILGFLSAIPGSVYALYDISGGQGTSLVERLPYGRVAFADQHLMRFMELYARAAIDGITVGLAGGLTANTLPLVVGRLGGLGFNTRVLSVDAESALRYSYARGLDELKVKHYLAAAGEHILENVDE